MYSGELKYCTSMAHDFPAMVSFKRFLILIWEKQGHLDENPLKKINQAKNNLKKYTKIKKRITKFRVGAIHVKAICNRYPGILVWQCWIFRGDVS